VTATGVSSSVQFYPVSSQLGKLGGKKHRDTRPDRLLADFFAIAPDADAPMIPCPGGFPFWHESDPNL
jgi:hypothetical protein